jgi:hypothetical protein
MNHQGHQSEQGKRAKTGKSCSARVRHGDKKDPSEGCPEYVQSDGSLKIWQPKHELDRFTGKVFGNEAGEYIRPTASLFCQGADIKYGDPDCH